MKIKYNIKIIKTNTLPGILFLNIDFFNINYFTIFLTF